MLIGGNGTRNKFIYEVTVWDELRSSFPDDSRTSRSSPRGTPLRDRFLKQVFEDTFLTRNVFIIKAIHAYFVKSLNSRAEHKA